MLKINCKLKLLSICGVLISSCIYSNISLACSQESAESLKKIASVLFGNTKTKTITNCWGDNPDASWADYGSSGHGGIDISSSNKGNPNFYSISEGKVIYAGGDTWNTIAIYDAKKDVTSIYLHASSVEVKINDTVDIGDMLGQEGSKGTSIDHVHFEVRPKETRYSVFGKERCGSPARESTSCTKNPEEYALNYLAGQPIEAESSPDLEIIAKNEKIVIEETIDPIDNYLSFYSRGLLKGNYIYPSGYKVHYKYPLISQTIQRQGDFYQDTIKNFENASGFIALIIAANYDTSLFSHIRYRHYERVRSVVKGIKESIDLDSSQSNTSISKLAKIALKMNFEEVHILGKNTLKVGNITVSANGVNYTQNNIYTAMIEIKSQLREGKFVIALATPHSALAPKNSSYYHAIIINSINNTSIRYTDPWDGAHKRKGIDEFFDSIYFGSTQDFLAVRKKDIVRRVLPAILHNQ